MPGVDLHQFMVALRDFVVNWWPLLGLTFYCVLLYIFWRMLQLMPRVKPATVIVDPRTAIDWNDIAGADEAKMELAEIVEFLRDPKRFEQLGAVVPKGVLLYGPPGTGKTLLARATATESGAKFYAQSASAFVEMFAGLGAARIRKLFAEARKNAPSIIFIDELDAVGAARTGSGFNREQDQTLNQLLVELDGFEARDQVIVMGASNRLQDLDTALLRLGWWSRAAGQPLAAVQAYRGVMSAYPKMPEILWARAGLALAFLDLSGETRGLPLGAAVATTARQFHPPA